MSDTMMSFGPGGPKGLPGPLPRIQPDGVTKITSDGKKIHCGRFYCYHFAAKQQLPSTKTHKQAQDWVRWVFQHSLSWARAGVWFEEVEFPRQAHFIFIYDDPPIRCGMVRDATACSSGGLVKYANTNIGDPAGNTWFSRGVLHEGAHEAFNARHDGNGVMRVDGSNVGIRWPTDNDILAVRRKYVDVT